MKRAVVLLSGGLDSATTLAICRGDGFEPHALSFDYGQRHKLELEAAKRVAASLGAREHRIALIDLRVFGGSALTTGIAVPKNRETGNASEIPITYVPARNTIFLSYALAWCEVLGAADIFIGANAIDYSGYPDCRPEFIAAFERLANVATKAGVEGTRFQIHAPLIAIAKQDSPIRFVTPASETVFQSPGSHPARATARDCSRAAASRRRVVSTSSQCERFDPAATDADGFASRQRAIIRYKPGTCP